MQEALNEYEKRPENNGYVLCMLIFCELFMSFSFLGYIHIEPISITFTYIPVMMAGCLLGPKEAALVGAVFGLASMWKASAFYVSQGDALFSPLMSGRPLQSILLSVGARILFGLVIGILYQIAKSTKNAKKELLGILLVTSIGRTLHAFLVYLFMGILFPGMGFQVSNVLNDTLRWDFPIFLLAADVIICVSYKVSRSDKVQRFWIRIRNVDQMSMSAEQGRKKVIPAVVLSFLASVSVALYFTNRIEIVMARYGLKVSEQVSYDLVHLQIQLLLGIISLAVLVALAMILHLKNFSHLYYEASLDGLTGLMNRKKFFQVGKEKMESLKEEENGKNGFFIMMDVDSFKKINDRYGHPTGDRVLKEIAGYLRDIFADKGIVGRLGGDEFVVLICDGVEKEELETLIGRFRRRIKNIRMQNGNVTCSIGVTPVKKGLSVEKLYRSADQLLYEAKKEGKNQVVFGCQPGK
ncbi:MAG TPA: diguanylate cyclase [Candidatus Enterocloster faecavium]|uniref:Diguanylate cyclase n=1 Tax=Candidatus Enterocloster faecavium TaxID=2838560 RepID=A0A9D2RLY7_9FIRM|nr:diguanylate cyclase [Candidatus Enterocloster faecavium]